MIQNANSLYCMRFKEMYNVSLEAIDKLQNKLQDKLAKTENGKRASSINLVKNTGVCPNINFVRLK